MCKVRRGANLLIPIARLLIRASSLTGSAKLARCGVGLLRILVKP
jgi:hypothetical protein